MSNSRMRKGKSPSTHDFLGYGYRLRIVSLSIKISSPKVHKNRNGSIAEVQEEHNHQYTTQGKIYPTKNKRSQEYENTESSKRA